MCTTRQIRAGSSRCSVAPGLKAVDQAMEGRRLLLLGLGPLRAGRSSSVSTTVAAPASPTSRDEAVISWAGDVQPCDLRDHCPDPDRGIRGRLGMRRTAKARGPGSAARSHSVRSGPFALPGTVTHPTGRASRVVFPHRHFYSPLAHGPRSLVTPSCGRRPLPSNTPPS